MVAEKLGLSEERTLWAIYRVAEWMRTHSKWGVLRQEPTMLDQLTGINALGATFIEVGWLKSQDGDFFLTPRFPCTPSYERKGFAAKFRKAFLDGKTCALCGAGTKLEIDHVFPVCEGGAHDVSNLQALCTPCNRKKSRRTP